MKRFMTILGVMCLVTLTNAQSVVDETFNHYAGKEGFTALSVGPVVFKIIKFFEPDDKDLKDITSKIHSFRLLTADEKPMGFTNELREKMKNDNYIAFMEITESNGKVSFFVRKNEDTITDFVMLVSKTDDEAMISLSGNFSLNDLSKLGSSSAMGDKSSHMAYLKQIKEN